MKNLLEQCKYFCEASPTDQRLLIKQYYITFPMEKIGEYITDYFKFGEYKITFYQVNNNVIGFYWPAHSSCLWQEIEDYISDHLKAKKYDSLHFSNIYYDIIEK